MSRASDLSLDLSRMVVNNSNHKLLTLWIFTTECI